jgi:hypothetical protein
VTSEAIRIAGLREFRANLKRIDSDLPKAMRVAFNGATELIVNDARPRVPRRSGRAAASIKVRSTQTAARIVAGGKQAPYYPWLDFGGKVGRKNSVRRPFLKHGRYIYNAYFSNKARYAELLEDALIDTVRAAGLDVD